MVMWLRCAAVLHCCAAVLLFRRGDIPGTLVELLEEEEAKEGQDGVTIYVSIYLAI
jgi:hypothetical protein